MSQIIFDESKDVLKDEESEQYHINSSTKQDPRNFKISESYLIGFDYASGDVPCLTVVKRNKNKLEVVNTFYGNGALDMYWRLTGIPIRNTK